MAIKFQNIGTVVDKDKLWGVILNKSPVFAFVSFFYLLFIMLIKWQLHPTVDALWFVAGGIIGVYLFDFAEILPIPKPSPYKTIVFVFLFTVVSFFIISSSVSMFARGIVLTMHLTLFLLQVGEWREVGNLNSWYLLVADTIPVKSQQLVMWTFGGFLLIETFLFVR